MIKIGYCASGQEMDYHTSLAHHPAFHPVREELPVRGKATKCPAFAEYCQSAFNIHVPYDLRFRVKKAANGDQSFVEFDRSFTTSMGDFAFHNGISIEDIDDGVLQLSMHPFFMFISDDPNVSVTVLSAQGQLNPEPIRGQFNIYNWFRGTGYAFKATYDTWYTITKDSPIYQVKFYHPTETNFVVSECIKTPFIMSRETGQHLHGLIGKQKWSQIFDFNKNRRPKKVLQFLDEQ